MMFFDKNLNLHPAAEEALKPSLVAMACIHTFAHQHHLIKSRLQLCNSYVILSYPYPPPSCLLMAFKRYVIPAGMYASQIWAMPCLQKGHEMDIYAFKND
eukprot:1152867-Pelagomonas_calceolata.AAC.1